MHPWLERLRRLPFPERLILGALLLLAAAVWAFVKIAGEVVAGHRRHFDEAILQALRRPGDPAHLLGPDWLMEMARDVTAFGGVVGIALVSGGVFGFLAARNGGRRAGARVGGGRAAGQRGAQAGIERERPGVVPHFDQVYTSSFPNGLSMLSAVTCLTLGALLAR